MVKRFRQVKNSLCPGLTDTGQKSALLSSPSANTSRIRRATTSDLEAIHKVHHRSIQELAARDYTPRQITAWTARAFDDQTRQRVAYEVHKDFVLVLEISGEVEGFVHMLASSPMPPAAYLQSLYITQAASGQGWARKLMLMAEAEAKHRGFAVMRLHSSKTGLPLYKKLEYMPTGPVDIHLVNGVGIERYPMAKTL